MRKFLAMGALALFLSPATAALAVPMCDGPDFSELDSSGHFRYSEPDESAFAERRLNAMGIDASLTRFWNGCIQTFVRENGHTVMRFYDPDTLREVPVN
jgi:hypothetical protein